MTKVPGRSDLILVPVVRRSIQFEDQHQMHSCPKNEPNSTKDRDQGRVGRRRK